MDMINLFDDYLAGKIDLNSVAIEIEDKMKESGGYTFLGDKLKDELYELGERYLYFYNPHERRLKYEGRRYFGLVRMLHNLLTGEPLKTEKDVREKIIIIRRKMQG